MILVRPNHEIMVMPDQPLQLIEKAGRTCYKSEDKIIADSASKFVENITARGHHSVIEHVNVTVRFICDRGVTHELVRHRLAAYSQESTRYCNYSGGVTFIIPPWVNIKPGEYDPLSLEKWDENDLAKAVEPGKYIMEDNDLLWFTQMLSCEHSYRVLLAEGWTPQQARSVLPNSLKTEIVMTANVREWRHVLTLRCSKAAHPQMRELMVPLLNKFKQEMPEIFGDIEY